MYEYISGTLQGATPHKAIVDVHGMGYGLFISLATFEKLPQIGNGVKFYTSFVVREDSQRIFGFLTSQERDFFETLCEISGIGPRLALAILGHMTIDDLHLAVEQSNTKAICQIPGIGKKIAERLVLELKDKFGKEAAKKGAPLPQGTIGDAISALIHLGYAPLEAQKAVKRALPEGKEPPLSELISLALKGNKS